MCVYPVIQKLICLRVALKIRVATLTWRADACDRTVTVTIAITITVAVTITVPFTVTITTGVCERNTPPERKRRGKVSVQSTKSGGWRAVSAAGLQGKCWHKRSVHFNRHRYCCHRFTLYSYSQEVRI